MTNAKLSTSTGELGGTWATWTPTLSGLFTDAKWDKTGKYTKIGKTVIAKLSLVANTTSPMGGSGEATFTLPVTSATVAASSNTGPLGTGNVVDTGTANYSARIVQASTTTANIRVVNASGTYATVGAPTSTAPMTFTTGDEINLEIVYEAAA